MKVTQHPTGSFCWAELVTSDGNGAKAFYTGLFGWRYEDNPMGPDSVYTMYYMGDGVVCASHESKEYPPHWGPYVNVPNVDQTAAEAKAAGGTVMAEPFDVMTVGRMAVLQDPTGAVISIWQPKEHIGYTVIDEPNAVCWDELNTTDTAAAGRFYAGTFGWDPKESQIGGGYTEFYNQGKAIAGMMAMGPEMQGVPPHWTIYFQVEDCDATVAKATSLGGKSCMPPTDIPTVGRFAIHSDPQGAAFGVIKLG